MAKTPKIIRICFVFTGERQAVQNKPGYRPALDFSSEFFSRYGDLEKEAVAAFDFLEDITTSVNSPDPNQLSSPEVERRKSQDMDTSGSVLQTNLEPVKRGSNIMTKQVFENRHPTGSYDTGSHGQFSNLKVERSVLYGVGMDQSVSSTDSCMTPVKKNRRKPRAKIKKGDHASGKRPLRRVSKFSSTSADESNDELSFSDSCCYHSFSSSSESLEDKV